jgi:uncharacterized protein
MSQIKASCRAFVKDLIEGHDASHDISHIDRVVTNAERIWDKSSAEVQSHVHRDIVVAIASLHDCFDHKYVTKADEVVKIKNDVSSFLESRCDFPPDIVRMIIDVIDNMGFTSEVSGGAAQLPETTMEYLRIVQDADRLDAMGAIGMCRCLAFSGAFGRPIITVDGSEERELREQFSQGSLQPSSRKGPSAIAHFYDKLVFLKDMLKTPAGRELGEKRHAFLISFLDNFFDELS